MSNELNLFAVWWVRDAERCWLMQDQPNRPIPAPSLIDEEFSAGESYYVLRELHNSNGRAGRGRLWVSDKIGFPVQSLPIEKHLIPDFVNDCAGIVVRRDMLGLIPRWLGCVTDCYCRVMRYGLGEYGWAWRLAEAEAKE